MNCLAFIYVNVGVVIFKEIGADNSHVPYSNIEDVTSAGVIPWDPLKSVVLFFDIPFKLKWNSSLIIKLLKKLLGQLLKLNDTLLTLLSILGQQS